MTLPWHLWLALLACSGLFLADCRVFYRNAVRAEFGWLNLLGMSLELAGACWLVVRGLGLGVLP